HRVAPPAAAVARRRRQEVKLFKLLELARFHRQAGAAAKLSADGARQCRLCRPTRPSGGFATPGGLPARRGLWRGLEQPAHALERQVNIVKVVGVAEPEKALAVLAKGCAGQTRHAGPVQKPV